MVQLDAAHHCAFDHYSFWRELFAQQSSRRECAGWFESASKAAGWSPEGDDSPYLPADGSPPKRRRT